jgi:uncharacterized membrane protein
VNKNRLEAFSDGVIAIIITIMVLELSVPHGTELAALKPLVPVMFSYLLSFVFVAIYWNNHHHLMHAHDSDSILATAIGSDVKGNVSLLLYALAVGVALFLPWVSCALYATVSIIWLVPDRRIENRLPG